MDRILEGPADWRALRLAASQAVRGGFPSLSGEHVYATVGEPA